MDEGHIRAGRSYRYDLNFPPDMTFFLTNMTCSDLLGHKSGTMATAHEGQEGTELLESEE